MYACSVPCRAVPCRAVPCRAVPPSAVLWVELVRFCRVLFPNSIAGPLGERRAAGREHGEKRDCEPLHALAPFIISRAMTSR